MSAHGATQDPPLAEQLHAFTEVSRRLQDSYARLEEEMARVEAGLAPAGEAARLRHVLDALPVAVLALDGEGRIREHNAAACALLGPGLTGRLWREVAAQRLEQSPQGPRLADGRPLGLTTRPLPHGRGQVLVLADVTAPRRRGEAHRRLGTVAAAGELAGALAHQLRTPLATALLHAQQLQGHELPPERRQRAARALLDQLHRMEALVGEMLDFVRRRYAGDERFSLGRLLAELAASLGPQLAARGLRLETAPVPEVTIQGSPRVLLSALEALVDNAARVSPAGGRVTVAAGRVGDSVELRVGDQGPGVPERLRERIFDPFFSTREGGGGLGLALVRIIARAHGGEAWLARSDSRGSEFALRLPLAGAREEG